MGLCLYIIILLCPLSELLTIKLTDYVFKLNFINGKFSSYLNCFAIITWLWLTLIIKCLRLLVVRWSDHDCLLFFLNIKHKQRLSNVEIFVTTSHNRVNFGCCIHEVDRSTVAQMAEWALRDQKVPSLNPTLDPMRRVSKYNPYWWLYRDDNARHCVNG